MLDARLTLRNGGIFFLKNGVSRFAAECSQINTGRFTTEKLVHDLQCPTATSTLRIPLRWIDNAQFLGAVHLVLGNYQDSLIRGRK